MTSKLTFKIVLIGDFAVGKTSLIQRYVSGKFSEDYRPSIGTNFFTKKFYLNPETIITLQIWDIAGQIKKWLEMRQLYYKGTTGAIIVGDLERKDTFEQIEEFWVPDLIKHCGEIPFIIAANKNDLKWQYSKKNLKKLSKNTNASDSIITSAKTGDNVEEAFRFLSELLVSKAKS